MSVLITPAGYIGDFATGSTANFQFFCHKSDGVPVSPVNLTVKVYKDSGVVDEPAVLGLSSTHGTHPGLVNINMPLTNLTGTFFEAGHDYSVVLHSPSTVDGKSVTGTVVGLFSIENRSLNSIKGSGWSSSDSLKTISSSIQSASGNVSTAIGILGSENANTTVLGEIADTQEAVAAAVVTLSNLVNLTTGDIQDIIADFPAVVDIKTAIEAPGSVLQEIKELAVAQSNVLADMLGDGSELTSFTVKLNGIPVAGAKVTCWKDENLSMQNGGMQYSNSDGVVKFYTNDDTDYWYVISADGITFPIEKERRTS